jgi:predicted metalloendopeptidase
MARSLRTRDWMSEQTRERGLDKLASFGVKIGYPDRWRDWSGLEIGRTSYAGNRLAATRFELDRQLSQLTEQVDTSEWDMPPHVVNAYYHPTRNEIVFPAGILQEPMFDPDADDAVNYGGIGTVIAHEVTHGFDDQGRRFAADGRFADWWTPEDEEHFTGLAEALVEQFDEYVAVGEVRVNGRLTLGENIADLGGIALASRAHARVSDGAPDIDGLSPAQRFFLANAAVWRARTSEELARTLAQVDVHAPREWRVRGPVSNSTDFQEAFGLPDDAPALRPRDRRIEIW